MSSTGKLSLERGYMLSAVARLKAVIDALNAANKGNKCKEPITVIAHSQGSIIALSALQQGAKIDNLIVMGSPLDVWPFDKKDNDLLRAYPRTPAARSVT
jgi:alpha-beta hydrolase superfamily lysophospholipase